MNLAISVIIPTRNKPIHLEQTLNSLKNQTLSPDQYEVIVANNGSTEPTASALRGLTSDLNLVEIRVSQIGAAAARNAGIRRAAGELLLFLDDDILVRPDHLERHLEYHNRYPNSVILGDIQEVEPVWPPFLDRRLRGRGILATHVGQSGGVTKVDAFHFTTGNVSIRRSTLQSVGAEGEIGCFDEQLKMREDLELGYRLERNGIDLLFTPDISCSHIHKRDWKDVLRRTYQAGYYLHHVVRKHPELYSRIRYLLGPTSNSFLFLTCLLVFPAGYLLHPISEWLLHKSLGGFLVVVANWGFLRAKRDLGRTF